MLFDVCVTDLTWCGELNHVQGLKRNSENRQREGGRYKEKKNKAALLGSPCRTVNVCDKTKPKKFKGTSPTLKNLLLRTEQQNIQARENTPIINVAVHYVATHVRSI